MALCTLPTHPRTGLTAVGFRRDGRPIWPILGGSEPLGQPPVPGPPPAAPASEPGFPANTPLEQMSVDQREAYWKHQARKHEDRVKAYGGLTPESLAEMREKAQRADELEHDLMSDRDRAVLEAATEARLVAESDFVPRLVRAEFRAELKGRIPDDQLGDRLDSLLEPLDLSKFLTESGDVDTAKVASFLGSIAPATGPTAPPPSPRGPSPSGLGHRPGSSAAPSVASGREIYAQRHRKQT